jgi:hypothetical protein
VPISAPEVDAAEAGLLEAARAFESGEHAGAAALWRERAIPALRREWPEPLAAALGAGLELVMELTDRAAPGGRSERAVAAWDAVAAWLEASPLPLAGGRSTPAHYRKHKRDPEVYRAVGLTEHLRLAGAGRAVALNNRALALMELGRAGEAGAPLREAAELRRAAFGWREAGLAAILRNSAALAGSAYDPPADLIAAGADRFQALAQGQPELQRRLLAAAQLVPILRRPAG